MFKYLVKKMGISVIRNIKIKVRPSIYTLIFMLFLSACGLESNNTPKTKISDIQSPDISLIGSNHISVSELVDYVEYGAAAHDLEDGYIRVSIDKSQLSEEPGTYVVIYTASDRSGNTSTVTRSVTIGQQTESDG